MRRVLSLGLGIATVAACVAAGVAGASRADGNDPATVAFYKQVQASYGTVPAVRVRRHGFLWYSVGKAGSLVRWVSAKKPPAGQGFRPAAESILVLLTNGRVAQYVDTATATGLPALTIIEGSGGLAIELHKKSGACFQSGSRAGDVAGWGLPFVGVYGTFAPMQTQGDTVIVRSTYPWLQTGHASEVDRISATTKHLESYTVTVTGSSPLTFGATNQNIPRPAVAPAAKPRC